MVWHHSPYHYAFGPGIYMVTAATYRKQSYLLSEARRDYFQGLLFRLSHECRWFLRAWVILPNHYHFLAVATETSAPLSTFLRKLHSLSARLWNREDERQGRKVWYQYWDSQITYESSYYARLRYIHENPVKHGLVRYGEDYPWSSCVPFLYFGEPSLVEKVRTFPIDRLKIEDDF